MRRGLVMRGVRRVVAIAALWSLAGAGMAALPARAAGMQHCQAIKGSIVASPGLTDVPADQAITLLVRVTGCSRTGGAALLAASTGAAQATCSSLTTSLLPATATFAWANGKTSTVSLSFVSVPGSPNRLALDGRVLAGAGAGDRIQSGLHLSATFTRILKNSAQHHKRVETSRRKEQAPLTGGDCTAAEPTRLDQGLELSEPQILDNRRGPRRPQRLRPRRRPRRPVHNDGFVDQHDPSAPQSGPAVLQRPPPPAPRPAVRSVGVASDTTSSNSGFDPESVLGAVCIGAAVCLLIVLLIPSRRIKRRRGTARLVR